MPGKRSMSRFYLVSLVMLATVPVLLLGSLWISEQHRRFEEQSRTWRSGYIDSQQQALSRRVADIVSSLDFERASLDRRQRETLQRAVDNGMAQLDTLMRFSGSKRSRLELRARARDLLAPIRFGNGRDHYIIYSDDGTALLLPAYPQSVGRNVADLRDVNGDAFATTMMQRARDNGESYLDVWYPQTDGRNGALLTTQYLRYYAPLGIFLGAAAYVEDMTQAMQRDELERLANKAGQEDMVLRISDHNNVVLLDTLNPALRGKRMSAEENADPAIATRLQKIVAQPGGGFVQMRRERPGSAEPQPILVYIRNYPGWHWNIGAGYFLDPLESAIARQREVMRRDLDRRALEGVLVVALCAIVAVLIAGQLARRTHRALRDFTAFFAAASRNATSIAVEQLPYAEFEVLARDANAMVMQRNNIEQALRRSEQRFEMALSAADIHLWEADLRDGTVTMSGTFFARLGYEPESRQVHTSEVSEWLHPDDIGVMKCRDTADRAPHSCEYRVRTAAGSYRWFMSRGANFDFDKDTGAPIRALGTVIDITVRKQMEQELIAARITAEDASHAKSQFLSSISHELRTPLNGVLGYAQILLRDSSTSKEQRHNLRAIESCGQHLLTLIDDVLDLAKIESGKIEIHESACDLYDLLESVSNIVRERVDVKGLSYELDIAAQVPATILIDEVKLRQILVNLLANAVKFTEQGGITLRVSLRDGSAIQFQVQDTGIGIPLDRQSAIFEPFQQLGRTATGSGLGLPISQRLCEAMGGVLNVQSAVGTGSCFSFSLPLRVAVPTRDERVQRAAYQVIDTGGRQFEIMVVDDNLINRQVMAGMLRASGIEVCEAENGQDALEKLRAHPVPLVLMDVRMPVLDGFAATAAIKADPQLCDTIVIAVSASVFPDVIVRMREQGCADFVGKPVRLAELLGKVAAHLQLPLRAVQLPLRDAKPAFAAIPDAVRGELASAIAVGDLEAMQAALKPLHNDSPQAAALARHIERLLEDFDIDAVRELIAQ